MTARLRNACGVPVNTQCGNQHDSAIGRLYSSVPVCHSVPTKMAQHAPPGGDDSSHAPARARKGKGDVYLTLIEVAKLPIDQRRPELLKRLEEVWESARCKAYVNKHGDEISSPDHVAMLRVIEVADAMLVEVDEKQKKRGQLVEMAIFNTQKRTG
jgi:hypothetical protein